MEDKILNLLRRKDYVPLNVPELLRRLKLSPNQQQELQSCLRSLEQRGFIARTKGNRYIPSREADLIPGRIRMNRQGKGFLQPDDPALQEIVIPAEAVGSAMNEDRVLVRREVKGRPGRGMPSVENTGTVIRILERRRTQVVGTLQRTNLFLFVAPDDPRMPQDIYVPEPRDVGRRPNVGDKVVVEIKEWGSPFANPEGEIIEVLGPPDEEGVDMLSVLRQYELPLHFPREVLEEARANPAEVQPEELTGRVDCRAHSVVTIDPDDAKDFDDAICLTRQANGTWKLWVHIADVSHYVRPGSALDTEARKRGNSTYLVDRVIPMLPEALSNELCSLKPEVDRLTKCVEFLIDREGKVQSAKFYSAVIHSKRRYTYKEVFAILQGQPKGSLEKMLHEANDLAQKIRSRRFQNGSLDLDFPERKIRLDEHGRVERIEKVENDISHQLIEEYMLLANEAVAGKLMGRKQTAVYRVHEAPKPDRLDEFRDEVLSYHIQVGDLNRRVEVQKLLARLSELPIGPALKIGFLKSLMRARYAAEPLGHYGLAKERYTHFTSPIRRYADLVVHRILFEHVKYSKKELFEIADHISATERNSADAERDSKDVKLFAFLKQQLESGNPVAYPALVTDVRNFGFFVDVPDLTMSGLVSLSSLEDDFYIFDPNRNQLVGRRSRQVIRLGDKVTVQIAKINTFKKLVDFRLVQQPKGRKSSERIQPERVERGSTYKKGQEQRRERPGNQRHGQVARGAGAAQGGERKHPSGEQTREPHWKRFQKKKKFQGQEKRRFSH